MRNVEPLPTVLSTSIQPWCCFDNAIDRRQAEAGALAHFLGGEKRLEDVRQVFRGDATASISHRESNA